MNSRMTSKNGFTIVELLIVIVVIGILAAITIVAYNGIQTRAENTKTIQTIAQYVKGINAYLAINGTYPVQATWPCMGPHPASCGNLTDSSGACYGVSSTGSTASFDTMMKSVMGSVLPSPSDQRLTCSGKTYTGAWYHSDTGKNASIEYFLRGNQACEGIGGIQSYTKSQQGDTTYCLTYLPVLS